MRRSLLLTLVAAALASFSVASGQLVKTRGQVILGGGTPEQDPQQPANKVHRLNHSMKEDLDGVEASLSLSQQANDRVPAPAPSAPLRCFEVNRPPRVLPSDNGLRSCTVTLVTRSFTNSYGSPSTLDYSPSLLPSSCQDPSKWVRLTLTQEGNSTGRQFDRLGSVQLEAVEIWRTDNPEPTRNGIIWKTTKDVDAYYDLFSKPGSLVFDYPNIVDETYTGALNITLSLTVYSRLSVRSPGRPADSPAPPRLLSEIAPKKVLPLSKLNNKANSFFVVGGDAEGDDGVTQVTIPRHTTAALVEIHASGTAQDEFWYTNVPNSVFDEAGPAAASLGLYPRGMYRELQLLIDGKLAGIVLPYAAIFTGGINPLLWRPQAAFGAFVQPTYYVDVSPFIGTLTDDKPHSFKLQVISAEKNGTIPASWFISGSLQLALGPDPSKRTVGTLDKVVTPEYNFINGGQITGNLSEPTGMLTAQVKTQGPRTLRVEGTVDGKKIVWEQEASYDGSMTIRGSSDQNVTQKATGRYTSTHDGKPFLRGTFSFPLDVTLVSDASSLDATVKHSFDLDLSIASPSFALPSSQKISNEQSAEAKATVSQGAISGGVGSTKTRYSYEDSEDYSFQRSNSVYNATVTDDHVAGSLAQVAPPV